MINRVLFFLTLLLSITLASAFTSSINRPLKGLSPTQLRAAKKAATKSKSVEKAEEEVVNFRKAEFVAAVAEKTGMTKADSEKALSAVLSVIASEVASGKRISLPGFGTFKLSHRAARKGRNPKTGEEMDIKASNSPNFSASKTFKDLCNPDR